MESVNGVFRLLNRFVSGILTALSVSTHSEVLPLAFRYHSSVCLGFYFKDQLLRKITVTLERSTTGSGQEGKYACLFTHSLREDGALLCPTILAFETLSGIPSYQGLLC